MQPRELEPEGQARIDDHIRAHKTIPAMKVYRDMTGCQLIEARDYVYARYEELGIPRWLFGELPRGDVTMMVGEVRTQPKRMPLPTSVYGNPKFQLELIDAIRKIVDCGCCTISGGVVGRVAEWWTSMDFGMPTTEAETTTIADVYNFYAWHIGYHPAKLGM